MFNPNSFKAYDVRGVYPTEVDEDLAYRLGRAFAEMIKRELKKETVQIVVGRDMRISSPQLTERVIAGISDEGADVIDVGLVSTPTFYFAVAKNGYDGGIQVSASHNPAEYNGFKMVRQHAIPVGEDSGIMDLKKRVIENDFKNSDNKGLILKKDVVLDDQIAYELEFAGTDKIKPFKIIIDTANAMGGPMFEKLFAKLPCELIKLNFELDGTFPVHEADPLKEENMRQLQEKVLSEGSDLGIALDGDADRIFYVTNEGKTVDPAIIRGILAKIFLRQYPGAKIGYDIRPGQITIDMIEEAGGIPVVTRVGHSLIKKKAIEEGAVFAGESSGHFFMKFPFGFFESPVVATLKLLQEISAADQTLAEYIKPLQKYFHSGEINFVVSDKDKILNDLRAKYGANLKYDFDGLSFEWLDWWFNVRPSNTENKIRLNLEARTEDLMKEKTTELINVINAE